MIAAALTLTLLVAGTGPSPAGRAKKVQVFVLAGQSNMEGHGQLASLAHLGDDPAHAALLAAMRDTGGGWAVRDDVSIVWAAKARRSGPLSVGWGVRDDEIGPELAFGTVVGDALDAPVLLIKTAWGGKDVYCDFRSPGAGEPAGDAAAKLAREREKGNAREVGRSYRQMLAEIRDALGRLDELVPGYQGQGYALAGLAWFQGWNDYCVWREAPGVLEQYPANLTAMIRDLRAELGVPDLPVAIGEMGVGGLEMEARAANAGDQEAQAMMRFRKAQRAVAEDPTLEHVVFVPTAGFWDARLDELRAQSDAWSAEKRRRGIADSDDSLLPTKELSDEYRRLGGHWYCHYDGSAATYSLVGEALAKALLAQAPAGKAAR